MRIWFISVGEPLPTDGRDERLLRTGILAERFAQRGHDVVWWTSAFDHARKQHRTRHSQRIVIAANYHSWLLHANGYAGNLSLRRVFNHRRVARQLRALAPRERRPDIILCSWPTLELCVESVRLGSNYGIPVVLDIRDLWPDAITDLAPRMMRPIARFLLRRAYQQARFAASRATAVTGITEEYIDWALAYAGRARTDLDRHFPMGYVDTTPSNSAIQAANDFWAQRGIVAEKNHFVACWFGMMGCNSEIGTVIAAARQLAHHKPSVRFVLCGTGPKLEHFRALAADCPNVVLPGRVNATQIWTLLRLSSVGLAPFVSSDNYIRNVPNKPVEYLSAGLPVISSLQGVLAGLLSQHDCGITYPNARPDELARAITELAAAPARRRRMSENAALLYRAKFVADNVYSEMHDYLEHVANSATSPVTFARAA